MSDNTDYTDEFKVEYDVPEELRERLRNYQLRAGDVQQFKDDVVVELSKKALLNGSSDQNFTVKNLAAEEGAHITGSATLDQDLVVKGKLTVEGEVTGNFMDHLTGNVFLGDEDADAVTVHGSLKSAHTSGGLEIDDALHVSEKLDVDENADIGGLLSVKGNAALDKNLGVKGALGIGVKSPLSRLDVNGDLTAEIIYARSVRAAKFEGGIEQIIKGLEERIKELEKKAGISPK